MGFIRFIKGLLLFSYQPFYKPYQPHQPYQPPFSISPKTFSASPAFVDWER